jgi:hypothetical protein
MKKTIVGSLTFVIITLFTSCVTPMGTFTILSTKDIDWSKSSEYRSVPQTVIGKDLYQIVIFIPSKETVSIEQAVSDALEQIPGAVALLNATILYKNFYIPFIYGQSGFIVKGTVLIGPE